MQKTTLTYDQSMPFKPRDGTFLINEIFYTVQGEGMLSGVPMVFVRFARCNLRCTVKNVGFDCDTDFQGFYELTSDELISAIDSKLPKGLEKPWVLLTGGEPGLQITQHLVDVLCFKYRLAIETNGTMKLPTGIDWVCCSPKSSEHTIRQREVDEVKIVRAAGQALPLEQDLPFKTKNFLVSPAFDADGLLPQENLEWCLKLVKETTGWRLSLQTHKFMKVR